MSTGGWELLLRFADGHEELRLTDHLDSFRADGGVLVVEGERWAVTAEAAPTSPSMSGRLICDAIASPQMPRVPVRPPAKFSAAPGNA